MKNENYSYIKILKQYGLKDASVSPIVKETVNRVLLVQKGNKKAVLKICRINKEEAAASVHVQKKMSDLGAPVPSIILSSKGEEFFLIDGNVCFLQEYIEGREFDPEIDGSPEKTADFIILIHTFLDRLEDSGIEEEISIPVSDLNFKPTERIFQNLKEINTRGIPCADALIMRRSEMMERNERSYPPLRLIRLIHNDLRPRNLMITPEGKWILLDFDFVRRGDVCFDLGSAAMFLSGYKRNDAEMILELCCRKYLPGLTPQKIIENLRLHYLENNFPFNRNNVSDTLISITCKERLKALDFCERFSRNSKGKIVEICGIDGAGKTTLLQNLSSVLSGEDYVFKSASLNKVYTEEIEGKAFEVGKNRREWLSPAMRGGIRILDLLELYYKEIVRNFTKGKNVILDRFTFSSYVYGLLTNDGNLPETYQVYNDINKPDLILYLDVEPEIAAERIKQRGVRRETYENITELQKLHGLFCKEITRRENVIVINANQNEIDVLRDAVSGLIKKGCFYEDLLRIQALMCTVTEV